jgi:hypothetical protein
MESNIRNIIDLGFGIAFAWLFKWKIFSLYKMAEGSSKEYAVFFAGLFIFYFALRVFRYFFRSFNAHGFLSFGTITGIAFVLYFILTMIFAHSSQDIFTYLLVVFILWVVSIGTLAMLIRMIRR